MYVAADNHEIHDVKVPGTEYLDKNQAREVLGKDPGNGVWSSNGDLIAPVPYEFMTETEKANHDRQVVRFGPYKGKTLAQVDEIKQAELVALSNGHAMHDPNGEITPFWDQMHKELIRK